MDETAQPEAIRRNVHLPCSVELGGRQVFGHTVSVGSRKLYARFLAGQLPEPLPEPSAPVTVQLQLPDGPLRLSSAVLWVDPSDRTGAQRPAVGLGLEVVGAPALGEFLRNFRHRVLFAEPDEAEQRAVQAVLGARYRVEPLAGADEALARVEAADAAMLIASTGLGELALEQLVARARELRPQLRILLLLGKETAGAEALLEAGRPFDVLARPYRPSQLEQIVHRAVESHAIAMENEWLQAELEQAHQRLRRENLYLQTRLEAVEGFESIIGKSLALRRSLSELAHVRKTDASVYIHGETGTGKELVARALHFGGPRSQGPFVSQNCAGVPESLLESTLFGHRRGAFTGAVRDHPGLFQQAHGGTLFLDEVSELSPKVQASLLRALEEDEVIPLGGDAPVKVDVRIICATHTDLAEAVRQGRFREDLYFRLVVVTLRLPALRSRSEDVPLLAAHFLELYSRRYGKELPGFTPEALAGLMRHRWPGNVRELENAVERAVVLADDGQPIGVSLLPAEVLSPAAVPAEAVRPGEVVIPTGLSFDAAVDLLEKTLLARALEETGQSVSRAADRLRIERSRLGKLRKRLGLGGDG